jgi:hypothetical protein
VSCCSIAQHDALKLDRERWSALLFVGVQNDDDGRPELELRNCACGSTLAIAITPEVTP